jgi:hypothetical protein
MSSASDFDCLVDASTPLQSNQTFQTIQSAIDADCENILINSYSGFYVEDLILDNNVASLYSFNGATILGTGHTISQSKLDIRGISWVQPGDNIASMFVLTGDMDNLWIRNCLLDGGGVRGTGVIYDGEGEYQITELVINSTNLLHWSWNTILLFNVVNTQIAHNLFYYCIGRTIHIVYSGVFQVHDNALVNVRGLSQVQNCIMVNLLGIAPGYQWLNPAIAPPIGCGPSQIASYGKGPCSLFNNVQMVDVTLPDISDICFSLSGGSAPVLNVFDNVRFTPIRTSAHGSFSSVKKRELPGSP